MGKNKNKQNAKNKDTDAPTSPSKIPLPEPSSNPNSLPLLLSTLSDKLTETESSLATLLDSSLSLSEQLESLPLLDRAKFYVTLTYAIDSLIFCFLRTKGANYRDHPVMQELERVKIYIRKVNAAEQVPTERNLVVDQPAAQRMILHSIPKKQIVPDPNASDSAKSQRSVSTGRKRQSEYVTSDVDSTSEESEARPAKKSKHKNCRSPETVKMLTKAEAKKASNSEKDGEKKKKKKSKSTAPSTISSGDFREDVRSRASESVATVETTEVGISKEIQKTTRGKRNKDEKDKDKDKGVKKKKRMPESAVVSSEAHDSEPNTNSDAVIPKEKSKAGKGKKKKAEKNTKQKSV